MSGKSDKGRTRPREKKSVSRSPDEAVLKGKEAALEASGASGEAGVTPARSVPDWPPGRKWGMDVLKFTITFMLGGLLSGWVFSCRERSLWEDQVRWQSGYALRKESLDEFFKAALDYGAIGYDVLAAAYYEHHGNPMSDVERLDFDETLLDQRRARYHDSAYDAFKRSCQRLRIAFAGTASGSKINGQLDCLVSVNGNIKQALKSLEGRKHADAHCKPKEVKELWKSYAEDGLDDLLVPDGVAGGYYGQQRRQFKELVVQIYEKGAKALRDDATE